MKMGILPKVLNKLCLLIISYAYIMRLVIVAPSPDTYFLPLFLIHLSPLLITFGLVLHPPKFN